MCVVSMIGDLYTDKWSNSSYPSIFDKINTGNDTKEEFESLKKEVLEMKKLLEKALEYDKKNNEPHCEVEDKIAILKKVADLVGVNLTKEFGS